MLTKVIAILNKTAFPLILSYLLTSCRVFFLYPFHQLAHVGHVFNAQASNRKDTYPPFGSGNMLEIQNKQTARKQNKDPNWEKAKLSKSKKAYEIQFSSESLGPCFVGLF